MARIALFGWVAALLCGCIREAPSFRMLGVAAVARHQHYWLIEPLLRVGMDVGEIRTGIIRLAFDCIVDAAPDAASSLTTLADRPPEVRAAWAEVIARMLALGELTQDC